MTGMNAQIPSVLFVSNVERGHPLLRSQGIPLIDRLSREGWRVGFLSIENRQTSSSTEDLCIRDSFQDRVALYPVRMDRWMWLRGWVRKILWGTLRTLQVQRQHRYRILHARSFEPAVMAWLATMFYGGKWIYDTRNFFWEEKVELGRIGRNIFTRMGFAFDRYLVRKADTVIAVTEAARFEYAKQMGAGSPASRRQSPSPRRHSHESGNLDPADRLSVIHNNYDPQRFTIDAAARSSRRMELGISDRHVLIYSGSLIKWHRFEDMATFCNQLQTKDTSGYTLWCSYEWNEETERWAKTLLTGDYRLLRLAPAEVCPTLQAADAGLMFLTLTKSRTTTIPIKFAEYLACGMPVVVNQGIGDPEEIVRRYRVGVVVQDMTDDSIDRAVNELLELLHDPNMRDRAVEAAKKEFHLDMAIEKYKECYHRLATT